MAEHDNAGFPLTYCLLSTATAIDHQKRMKALVAWTKCLRDKYRINPIFAHVDKDMAEVGCLRQVWNVKISLCWWHLRRAVRTRLAKAKLSTTPYNAKRAHAEFSFIDEDFIPSGKCVDVADYEGGPPEDADLVVAQPSPTPSLVNAPSETTRVLGDANVLRIKIPLPSQVALAQSGLPESQQQRGVTGATLNDKPGTATRLIQGNGFTLRVLKSIAPADLDEVTEDEDEEINGGEDGEKKTRRTFCPVDNREPIINMMERHYCTHPVIPGYAAPDPISIKRWAVHQMYNYCAKHELREVWAYLWENWYRNGRWELWARAAHDMIPILKTTMILESQ